MSGIASSGNPTTFSSKPGAAGAGGVDLAEPIGRAPQQEIGGLT